MTKSLFKQLYEAMQNFDDKLVHQLTIEIEKGKSVEWIEKFEDDGAYTQETGIDFVTQWENH